MGGYMNVYISCCVLITVAYLVTRVMATPTTACVSVRILVHRCRPGAALVTGEYVRVVDLAGACIVKYQVRTLDVEYSMTDCPCFVTFAC